MRDPYSIAQLAGRIIRAVDGRNSIWLKWSQQRELLLKSAVGCWVPLADLHEFLNRLPGPRLTATDVAQRLMAFEEEDYAPYPDERLQEGCLAVYTHEKAEGTELPAIIGVLREHVEREENHLREEQQQHFRQARERERVAREQRLLAGADCGWTPLGKSPDVYCRTNGRLYRLSPTKDKLLALYRTPTVDGPNGPLIGRYQGRRSASQAVAQVAYQPDIL
jgi:hypothetical protein